MKSNFMMRASVSRTSRGSIRSTHDRRDMLALQAEFDKQIYDSSLGAPLASFDQASLSLVGGKALQCWRLTRHGFPVPTAFVIPTYVYSKHISQAGVAPLIYKLFHTPDLEHLNDELETVRTKILETPLNPKVIENLKTFLEGLPPGSFFAVRSSGSAEDLASQSFAGQYDTFLYKQTVEEMCESIKACWASMFKPHILEYLQRSDAPKIQPPNMGVLVMKMVEAEASGVCFSQNVFGDKGEAMIEAISGQGEGLVSGEITPDRYVVDKYSSHICYSDITQQTHKYVKANNMDGVIKIHMEKPRTDPVLSNKNVKRLALLAKSIENFYNRPQDIEWAMDKSGYIYILQSRDITTSTESLGFLPPGDGFWTFDPTHFPRPFSHWMRHYSFKYYSNNSRRTGCLIKTIKMRFVHGYAFTQPELFPPSEEARLERAAEAYWTKQLYEDDYREFTDFFRADVSALQESLRVVNPSELSHSSLVDHVSTCFDLCLEFWAFHHTYTAPTMVVVGDYMQRMSKLTNKEPFDTLCLLESASPETRGILNKQDPLLGKMYKLLRASEEAQDLLRCDENMAPWALDCILHLPDQLGEVMREVSILYGWRLAGGYDLVVPTLIESPNFFLKSILQGVEEDDAEEEEREKRVLALCQEWRSSLPKDQYAEFDEILDVGRRFFRIRDERGLATDLSGVGLCRRGILEAGRRLVDAGVINQPEHLCCAEKEEALALMTSDLGRLANKNGPVDVPTASELERRFLYIKNADPSSIPRTVGTPPPPPPDHQLPPNIQRTMDAMNLGLVRGIWEEGDGHSEEDIVNNPDKVKGLVASKGKVKGPVCLVIQDDDLQRVKKGDIVVTYSTSASFNVVLGLVSGIVTDYGGVLSHAAIVSRERGIPCVTGTQLATSKFRNGDIVEIDAVEGVVTRVSG